MIQKKNPISLLIRIPVVINWTFQRVRPYAYTLTKRGRCWEGRERGEWKKICKKSGARRIFGQIQILRSKILSVRNLIPFFDEPKPHKYIDSVSISRLIEAIYLHRKCLSHVFTLKFRFCISSHILLTYL